MGFALKKQRSMELIVYAFKFFIEGFYQQINGGAGTMIGIICSTLILLV